MSTTSDLADAAQSLAASLLSACGTPADAIRLLTELANFHPNTVTGSDVIGVAAGDMQSASGDLFRRAAVVALAQASANYQPSSYNDAARVRDLVVALLDAEITVAGDQGEDNTFTALRALRVAVVEDLTSRGASLAPIITFTNAAPLPAPVLATKFYRDPSRADQLVAQANPVSPLFMPVSFQALAD